MGGEKRTANNGGLSGSTNLSRERSKKKANLVVIRVRPGLSEVITITSGFIRLLFPLAEGYQAVSVKPDLSAANSTAEPTGWTAGVESILSPKYNSW